LCEVSVVEEKALLSEGSQGLPVRSRKRATEEVAKPELAPAPPSSLSQDTPSPKRPRKPGDTETIVDTTTGTGYTFTLPSAQRYKTVMRRRFYRWGESVVLESNPRLHTLMQECISPKPGEDYALLSWLSTQFQIFLKKDEQLYDTNITDALAEVKPGKSVMLKSPFTGREYHLLIPTASEVLRVLPSEEQRIEADTGDILIELSAYDALLERYCAPAITDKLLEELVPQELEWLELALYLFLHKRGGLGSSGATS
jgi:hypothetical protein